MLERTKAPGLAGGGLFTIAQIFGGQYDKYTCLSLHYKKPLTQEEQYALARAATGLQYPILLAYREALDKVAEQFANEIAQLVPEFGLGNILEVFRAKKRGFRILPMDLVNALREKVQLLG